MTRKMPLTDFRAVRKILEPRDFAICDGRRARPTDLIEKKIWYGMMNLPDDVAITTSDHHGSKLKRLYILETDWLTAMGEKHDPLWHTMLDAYDCFQSCTFSFLHGYYRSALSNLRSALELVCIGTFGNHFPEDEHYESWNKRGEYFPFQTCRKRLEATIKGPEQVLFSKTGPIETIYRKLCGYVHARTDATDGNLWESNGPIHVNEAVDLVFKMQCAVVALGHLLVKMCRPEFEIPKESNFLFETEGILKSEQIVPVYHLLYTTKSDK